MEARKSSVRSGAARGAPRPAALDLRPCSHSGSARSAAAPPPPLAPLGRARLASVAAAADAVLFAAAPALAATVLPQDAFQQELHCSRARPPAAPTRRRRPPPSARSSATDATRAPGRCARRSRLRPVTRISLPIACTGSCARSRPSRRATPLTRKERRAQGRPPGQARRPHRARPHRARAARAPRGLRSALREGRGSLREGGPPTRRHPRVEGGPRPGPRERGRQSGRRAHRFRA